MIKKYSFALLLFCTLCNYPAIKLPADLLYHGKPLDAWVVSHLEMSDSRFEPKSIKGLLKQKRTEHVAPFLNKNIKEIFKDFIGYEFKDKKCHVSCYFFWKYLGTLSGSHKHVIQTSWFGGGSGDMGSVILVERHGDVLQNIEELFRGSRANGGLTSASFDNNAVTATQHATPVDIFHVCVDVLMEDTSNNVSLIKDDHGPITVVYKGITVQCKAYDDLASSALNYAGKIVKTWKNGTNEIDHIILDEPDEFFVGSRLQKCYDAVTKSMRVKSPILDKAKMAEFAKAVLDCYVAETPIK